MERCKKCSSATSVVQGTTRCQNCGHQERGESPYQTNKTYVSAPSTHTQIYKNKLAECEDLEKLHSVWTENKGIKEPEFPKISIIMPTYKRQHTIYTTIASILTQTFTAWELILIDNELGNDYKFDDPRIRYYKHSEELGAAYGRNTGIQYVRADLVCFFDDDDMMASDYLEYMSAPFFRDPKVNMVVCRIRLVEGRLSEYTEYCTPTVLVRKQYVTPSWTKWTGHDIKYFTDIVDGLPSESICRIPDVLARAYTSPRGGLREGSL